MITSRQCDLAVSAISGAPFPQKKLAVQVKALAVCALTFVCVVEANAQVGTSSATLESSAQTTQKITSDDGSSPRVVEEIIVTGIRFSQRSAIERKRAAGTMSDSIIAEDIGAFPDKNVAESLQRVAGVQLARDFGEGAQVSIRGVEPELLRIEVNSVSALGVGGRGVDFRDMASELVKSVDVIKGSEARLTEGGIGGTIQVETRMPNDFDDHFFTASFEEQYNNLTTDLSPKANLIGVYKFNEKLGGLVNITASDKLVMIHALRNTEWHRVADYDDSAEKTVPNEDYSSITAKADCAALVEAADQADCEQQWWDFSPRLPRYGIWDRQEKRISANVMLQYEFNDHWNAHIGYTFNDRDKTATDLNLHLETHTATRVDAESVVVDENHNVTYFESALATVTNRTLGFGWDQRTSQFETGFEFNRDNVNVKGLIARSTAEQDIDARDTHITANGVAGVEVTLDKRGAPEWDFNTGYFYNADDPTDTTDGFDVNSPASYRSRSRFKYTPHVDTKDETMAKVDAIFNIEDSFVKNVRIGYQLTSREQADRNWQANIIRDVGQTYNDIVWTMEDQIALISGNTKESPQLFEGYSLGVDTIGTYQALVSQPFIDDIIVVAQDNTSRKDLNVRSGAFDISEDSNATYIQSDFETDIAGMRLWGNAGVRYVETRTAAEGDVIIDVEVDQRDEAGEILVDPITGLDLSGVIDLSHPDAYAGRKTVKEDYTDFLPSLNLSLGMLDDEQLVLFLGVAKVMARPKLGDLNVNAKCKLRQTRRSNVEGLANTCTAGNPDLNPYRADQLDLALTWYASEDTMVSAAWFEKKITSWIIAPETREDIDFFNDGRLWDVKQRINGSGVTTKGIELQVSTAFTMLPAPLDGLGGSVNYTHMTADDVGLFNKLTGKELPFPSQSENSYNITGFYEKGDYSFRLAYNYRSEYLASAADRSGNPVYVDDAGYLDAKFTYTVGGTGFKVYVDARNLTDEVKLAHAGPRRLSDLQWSGREYSFGLSYKL